MFDYLAKPYVINLKEYIAGELGIEFETALTDADELNFDKSFLHFNVKKKVYPKASLNLTINVEY